MGLKVPEEPTTSPDGGPYTFAMSTVPGTSGGKTWRRDLKRQPFARLHVDVLVAADVSGVRRIGVRAEHAGVDEVRLAGRAFR